MYIPFKDKYNIKTLMEIKNMKFDVSIMNPPYGNLFLKILNQIISSQNVDKFIIVGPYQWIVEPWKKEKLNKTLKEEIELFKLKNYGVIDFKEINLSKAFDIGEERPGGILTLKLNQNNNFDIVNYHKSINIEQQNVFLNLKTLDNLKNHVTKYIGQKYFVPIRTNANMDRWWCYRLINYLDVIINGKVYSGEYAGKTIIEAREANPHENGRTNERETFGIACDTKQEAINLRDLFNSSIMLYIISLVKTARVMPLENIPYFECKNGIPTFNDIVKKCKIKMSQKIINELMKDR